MQWGEILGALGLLLGCWLTWLASGTSQLRARIADLETKYSGLWDAREADAKTKRAQGDHIDVLEDHIWQRLPPPPPARPPDA